MSCNSCIGDETKAKCDVSKLFDKKFAFTPNAKCILPESAFSSKKWQVPTLQTMKTDLNAVKGQLNKFPLTEWSKHTKFRDPSSFIAPTLKKQFNAELITQAWCKFYECLSQFDIIPEEAIARGNLPTLHLCEAPGAFISALNHYLVSTHPELHWRWFGSTLNPYYEGNTISQMIPDDRLIRFTRDRWLFGADGTGDLTQYYNHKEILDSFVDELWLVTADGSVDCMLDPGEQESNVHHLHYCEIMTALAKLRAGGSFVVKIFTMFEESTICHLYLLYCVFEKVHVFKPASSKSGNSEVYVVCMLYRGKQTISNLWDSLMLPYKAPDTVSKLSMFSLDDLGDEFMEQVICCATFFMERQVCTINDNVRYFKKSCPAETAAITCRKVCVKDLFIEKYNIKSIPETTRITESEDFLNSVASYYKRMNFSKKIFKNEYIMVSCPFSNFSIRDLLKLKMGKCIEFVRHSNFSHSVNVQNFSKIRSKLALDVALENVSSTSFSILDMSNYVGLQLHNEFQQTLFSDIRSNINDNIIFLRIPFLTSFLVGILFILSHAFSYVIAHRSGFIVLSGLLSENINDVMSCFDEMSEFYNSPEVHCDFKSDIIETVPLELLSGAFVDLIWQYNTAICD